jgi:catechol 2,3-dioxygenase-like lactoylglutathione lyase family enzyme
VNTPPKTRGIRHIALRVRDLATMERFYCDVLGYRVEWRPSEHELYLTRGEDNLALHAGRRGGLDAAGSLDHLGLLMDTPEDVHAWAAHLAAHGVTLETQPRLHRDGATSFYAADPEGNRIQFLHHPPISGK